MSDDETTGFSAEERAAMKERAKEVRGAKRGKKDGEADLLEKIAEMPDEDRVLAERLHELVRTAAPQLAPKTWYGQPAYAKDGKVVIFFQAASKFGTRYATLGFNDVAELENGTMWPTSFAITALSPEHEATITALVKTVADGRA